MSWIDVSLGFGDRESHSGVSVGGMIQLKSAPSWCVMFLLWFWMHTESNVCFICCLSCYLNMDIAGLSKCFVFIIHPSLFIWPCFFFMFCILVPHLFFQHWAGENTNKIELRKKKNCKKKKKKKRHILFNYIYFKCTYKCCAIYIISTGMHFLKWIWKGMKFYEDSNKYKRSVLLGLFGWCVELFAASAAPPWIISFPRRFGLTPPFRDIRNSNVLLVTLEKLLMRLSSFKFTECDS